MIELWGFWGEIYFNYSNQQLLRMHMEKKTNQNWPQHLHQSINQKTDPEGLVSQEPDQGQKLHCWRDRLKKCMWWSADDLQITEQKQL